MTVKLFIEVYVKIPFIVVDTTERKIVKKYRENKLGKRGINIYVRKKRILYVRWLPDQSGK